MSSEIEGLSELQIRTRRAYAVRQFAWFQAMMQCKLAAGEVDVAHRHARNMAECNDFIDACNRKLGDVA